MLPSGNDAAHLLAEHFGGLLKKETEENEEKERKEELARIK
jgi:D-alanyl-D-alanine carboxypeptidase